MTDDDGRPIGDEIDPPEEATQRMLPFGGVREQVAKKFSMDCVFKMMNLVYK